MANSYLQTEVLFTFLLLASVYWFVRWSDSLSWVDALVGRRRVRVVAVGSAGDGACGLRWLQALVVLCARTQRRRAAVQALAIGVMIAAVIMPWWVRNAELYDRFVPFSTSSALTTIEAIRMDVAVQLPFPWQSEPPRQTPDQAAIERLTTKALRDAPA